MRIQQQQGRPQGTGRLLALPLHLGNRGDIGQTGLAPQAVHVFAHVFAHHWGLKALDQGATQGTFAGRLRAG